MSAAASAKGDLFNIEVESAFIGLIAERGWSDPTGAYGLMQAHQIEPRHMSLPAHRVLLDAVRALLAEGKPTDSSSLWSRVKESREVKGAGGFEFVMGVCAPDALEVSIPTYARTLLDLALRRDLCAVARSVAVNAQDLEKDPAAVLSESSSQLAALTRGSMKLRSVREYTLDLVDEMEQTYRGERLPSLSSGIATLDHIIGGLAPTLHIIGALPGVGKSALVASMCQGMSRAGTKIGVFSLEDQGQWIAWRLLSSEARIPQFYLRNRPLEPSQMERVAGAAGRLYTYGENIIVDDRPGLTAPDVVQSARDMIFNHGVRCILVDHLGEVKPSRRHDTRPDIEIDESLGELRDIAKTHGVPIIVCVHLKRRQGLDPETEPKLTDFAGASAIERKARVALGLSRKPGEDTMRVTVMKQTNGPAGVSFDLVFKKLDAMVKDCEGPLPDIDFGQGEGGNS